MLYIVGDDCVTFNENWERCMLLTAMGKAVEEKYTRKPEFGKLAIAAVHTKLNIVPVNFKSV